MELAAGSIYEGKVTGVTKFGAFVSFQGGKSGLVHISEIANTFVSDVSKHVSVGQTVEVKVLSISDDGKINLSLKQAVETAQAPGAEEKEEAPKRFSSPVMHQKYNMAPIPAANDNSGDLNFEDRLKKFMQESDSRIADSRRYTDRRQRRGKK